MDKERAQKYAERVMALAEDTITVRLRFFRSAISKINIDYDPMELLTKYSQEPNYAVRLYLHALLHGLFLHRFRFDKTNEEYWNLATDIAVESVILDMGIPGFSLSKDDEAGIVLAKIRKWTPFITADKVYREFAVNGISSEALDTYRRLFVMDRHPKREEYREDTETIILEEEWKRISERVKTEMDSFDNGGVNSELLRLNLGDAVRKRFDYDSILRRFAVRGEEIKLNPDEFDYIYYTYGLSLYRDMPLIEPLEYAEEHRIREFVIALDTSASCGREKVRDFLQKTYEILKTAHSFFGKVNIHILQCDSSVKSDIRVTSLEEIDSVIENYEAKGFGATDFRPVFSYVDRMVENGEFENLRGIIYLTDGRGIYPSKAPDYDCMFVFSEHDEFRPKVPYWGISVELEDENNEYS